MNRVKRLIKVAHLRMIEMQIAMIADYQRDIKSQQQGNEEWLKECRRKEFELAAELEGVKVSTLPTGLNIVQIETLTLCIPDDAEALRKFAAAVRNYGHAEDHA